MLERLVSPSDELLDWVAATMREQHKTSIEQRDKMIQSIQIQIDRIGRMDDGLYDDKLSGDISQDKYKEKHEGFVTQGRARAEVK